MKAFQGNAELKKFVLSELAAHKEADEIIQGEYGQNGRGCAVGCTIHAMAKFLGVIHTQNDHFWLSEQLDIPEVMARLIDKIFEVLPKAKALSWPNKIIKAIPVGADLSLVPARFLAWAFGPILTDTLPEGDCKASVIAIAATFTREGFGEIITQEEKNNVAWDATRATRAAWAARAAWDATRDATRDARWAARASWAAWDATRATMAAWAARAAWDARPEWAATFTLLAADKLVELVVASPVDQGEA